MPTARTDDGVALSYRTTGDGPRNLLFMHGWGGSGAYFDELLEHLDLTGLRAITFDFRGHGDSEKAEGFTDERLGRDAFAVADAVGADQVVVVGYSMSGRFAQYLAVLEPERVLGQILVAGCPAFAIPFPDEMIDEWITAAGDKEAYRELHLSFTTRPVPPEALERAVDDVTKVSRAALEGTLRTVSEASFADKVGTIRAPTLVVGGIHDELLTPEVLRDGVAAPLSRARLVLLDCNHDIPFEQPRELAAVIEAFLAALP